MNDQPINDMNAAEEDVRPAPRRRRSERYEHPESESERMPEKTAEAPDQMKGAPEEAARAEAARQTGINPLNDLANRPSSFAAGGASRARALNPSRTPSANRSPDAYRKLENSGYPRTGASPAGQDRGMTTRVGYAPGRMEESEIRKETAHAGGQEAAGNRQAPIKPIRVREYPENRYQQEQGRAKPGAQPAARTKKKRKPRTGLKILLVLAVLLIAAAAALMLMPEDNSLKQKALKMIGMGNDQQTGDETPVTQAPDLVYSFTVSGHENQTAPADVTFSVTTAKSVTEVRLADEEGTPVETSTVFADNAEDNVWNLTLHAEDGYDGETRLQIREAEGEWQDTAYTAMVQVASLPAKESARETESPVPQEGTDTEVGVILQQPEADTAAENEDEVPAAAENGEAETEADGETLPAEGTDVQTELPDEPKQPDEEELQEETEEWTEETAEQAEETAEPEITEMPTPDPTPEPTSEPTAEPTEEPTPEPTEEPTPKPMLTAAAVQEADPELINTSIVYNGSKKVNDYNRPAKELIHMPVGGEYSKKNMGVLTFRSDAFRQNAAAGTVKSAEEMSIAWKAEAGSARGANQTYYGIGWTGQPAIVKWSKEVREKSSLYEEKVEKVGLKEVIIAGMDGVIYFLDLDDGSITRNSIKLGYPMKGTPSVHPSGFPYMSVGQFARKMKSKTGNIGLRQYNLYSGKEMSLIDGLDGKLHRGFNNIGSFETSALIDRTSDTLITAGTNGLLYLISLNSDFDYEAGTYRQSGASTVVLKTKARGEKKDSYTAVESSVAMYDRYVYYADMGGVLRCVDTNNLKTVWAAETGDAVEAAVALNLNDAGGLDLYTGNMLINRTKGAAQIRCYDAMSGAEEWMTEIPVRKDTKTKKEAGVKASPVVGQNQLKGLVYFTVTGISEEGKSQLRLAEDSQAALVALDRETGKVVWQCGLNARAESSPVAVYDADGRGWIIQAAENGEILLLEGLTGRVVSRLTVEGEIEASPAVYNDMMVIGTTGKGTSYIYGIRIQ